MFGIALWLRRKVHDRTVRLAITLRAPIRASMWPETTAASRKLDKAANNLDAPLKPEGRAMEGKHWVGGSYQQTSLFAAPVAKTCAKSSSVFDGRITKVVIS